MGQNVDILEERLFNTGLSSSPFKSAAEVVSYLGAMQAQDFAMARWSLGLRVKNSVEKDIDKAYNDGEILRVHVMRPTWHFVTPEDIRWMTELTATRVKAAIASSNRKLGLDEKLLFKSNNAIVKTLQGGKYKTRQELKTVLDSISIETNVQRLAHIIMRAELDGLICSGPRRGKQLTYALTEERVRKFKKLDREEALAALAEKYFKSHGPVQVEDFSWWSGLSVKDARQALDSIKSDLEKVAFDGKIYWHVPRAGKTAPSIPKALLLSIYDEYTIAYKDRTDLSPARYVEQMIRMGNALTAVIVIDGKVAGSWSRALNKNTIGIKLNPFRPLSADELNALKAEAERYSRFSGLPVSLI